MKIKKSYIILAVIVAIIATWVYIKSESNAKIVEEESNYLDQIFFIERYDINSDGDSVTVYVNDKWYELDSNKKISLAKKLQYNLSTIADSEFYVGLLFCKGNSNGTAEPILKLTVNGEIQSGAEWLKSVEKYRKYVK